MEKFSLFKGKRMQGRILQLLVDNYNTAFGIGDIEKILGSTSRSIGRSISELEKHGLVYKQKTFSDGRRVYIKANDNALVLSNAMKIASNKEKYRKFEEALEREQAQKMKDEKQC